ncbi:hypothetical protein EYF80_033017 [Liparis tanakae]|uniref:Uncharacterized protein n=1 Tax=Liparis tanakae TaxID=230148 RepID=A0A4Z2GTM4_9TELE|nr:hypothetical protein EYF80_033017 [Liparis tanakae]
MVSLLGDVRGQKLSAVEREAISQRTIVQLLPHGGQLKAVRVYSVVSDTLVPEIWGRGSRQSDLSDSSDLRGVMSRVISNAGGLPVEAGLLSRVSGGGRTDGAAILSPPCRCVSAGCRGNREREEARPGEAAGGRRSSPASRPSFFSLLGDRGSRWEAVGVA